MESHLYFSFAHNYFCISPSRQTHKTYFFIICISLSRIIFFSTPNLTNIFFIILILWLRPQIENKKNILINQTVIPIQPITQTHKKYRCSCLVATGRIFLPLEGTSLECFFRMRVRAGMGGLYIQNPSTLRKWDPFSTHKPQYLSSHAHISKKCSKSDRASLKT